MSSLATVREWMDLLFRIRVGKQVICLLGAREHSDLREARAHSKRFEIWRLSKSLILYPEGYRIIPPEEFEGLDGTIPKLTEELSAREVGGVLRQWLMRNRASHVIILHDNDPYWREVCSVADAESTASLAARELGFTFDLSTGEKEYQNERWPKLLRDFLDDLSEEDSRKIRDALARGES